MDGLLVIDKPPGPTSHDVVARMRRVLREKRVGHTGTLDPLATGVLPLVLGRATRLARFLTAGDKTYEAVIALGIATETADAEGAPIGEPYRGPLPDAPTIDRALAAFRGTFMQTAPAYSAKKIGGVRSYELARARKPGAPAPVEVRASAVELLGVDGARVTVRVECSAGFYVRSLARDLGERLDIGAHLVALRRTRSAGYGLEAAITMADAERDPGRAAAAVIPMGRMLPDFPAVTLASDAVRRAIQGRDVTNPLSTNHLATNRATPLVPNLKSLPVRLLDETGDLVGVAEPAASPGLLHPSVILR